MMFDVANAIDELRQLIAKTEALAHVAEDVFDAVVNVEDAEDRREFERLAHLIGATAAAAEAALQAGDQLAVDLDKHRPRA